MGRRRSGRVAKERLFETLRCERLECTPEQLENLRRELSHVLRKYFDEEYWECEIRLEFTHRKKQGVKDVKTIQIKGL